VKKERMILNALKITFVLKSPIRTAFQADTIFGHFCWALKYLRGEEKLNEFLSSYTEIPTLFSNGFPSGFFPKPILPPLTTTESKRIINDFNDNLPGENEIQKTVSGLDWLKQIKKWEFVEEDVILSMRDNFSCDRLHRYYFNNLIRDSRKAPTSPHPDNKSELVMHNTINRLSSTVGGGGLFQLEEIFFERDTSFWFLVASEFLSIDDITEIMNYIEKSGFGADKSVGKGFIGNVSIEGYALPHSSNSNAIMSLSCFVPSGKLPEEGYYRLFTKFGKLGGDYAVSENPFKKPIILMKEGSVFMTGDYTAYYGTLIDNVHWNEKIRHYGYVFPLGIRVSAHTQE
jgi:CRISPR-associated protein Csm4